MILLGEVKKRSRATTDLAFFSCGCGLLDLFDLDHLRSPAYH